MGKQAFWNIMNQARLAGGDQDGMLQEITRLAGTAEDILNFKGYLNSYLAVVDECVWKDMVCKVINGYVSDDTGLYFSLWLISQGEDVLLNVLKDPDSIASLPDIPFGEAEFEMLMSVGFDEEGEMSFDVVDDYDEDRLSEKFPIGNIEYKNGDRYGGYESFDDAMDDIPNILPNLVKRAESEGFAWKSMYDL